MKRILKPVDWLHWTIVVIVFSITSVLSMSISRLLLRDILQLDGDLWSGPWFYRLAYLLLILPFYSGRLVAVSTFLGKHAYFKRRVLHMWDTIYSGQFRWRFVGTIESSRGDRTRGVWT